MRTLAAVLLSLFALLPLSEAASAQQDECNANPVPEFTRMPDGTVFVVGPFLFQCTSGAELRADSGTVYPGGEILLVGNVDYRDAQQTLTAARATYSRPIRRLYATGNVVFTNRVEGTTIRGPDLEYFAVMPGRPKAQVNAGSRPHLTLRPRREGIDADDEPLEIDADRISVIGNDDLSAYGSVVITRTDLHATAAEARYDGATEGLDLRGGAVVRGKESVLRGEVVQAQLTENELTGVRARTRAMMESEDLTVTAPDIQLVFVNELVERAIARRGEVEDAERPVALSRDFRLVADSIDALTPAQRLQQVIAVGRARGESIDTTAAAAVGSLPVDSAGAARSPSLIDSDWLEGDTITGYFVQRDTAAAQSADSASAELERLVARGHAQSLYRIPDEDAAPDAPPGVSWVSAGMITVRMLDGEVEVTEVADVYKGIYLDPAPPAAAPPAPAPGGA